MTELDYLMAAIHDCGWQLAIHSWRDDANFAMAYELQDNNRRHMLIRVSDQALAMSTDPQILVLEAVEKLLFQYFRNTLKQPEAWNAVRKLASARMSIDTLNDWAKV